MYISIVKENNANHLSKISIILRTQSRQSLSSCIFRIHQVGVVASFHRLFDQLELLLTVVPIHEDKMVVALCMDND